MPNNITRNPFTLPNRRKYSIKAKVTGDGIDTTTLEGLRDHTRKVKELQQPIDRVFELGQMMFTVENGELMFRRMLTNAKGQRVQTEAIRFTKHGLNLFAPVFMPRSGANMLRATANTADGDKVAMLLANYHAQQHADKAVLVRTVLKQGPDGEVHRYVRSIHSANYAVHDEVDLLNDVLNTRLFDNARVMSFAQDDFGMVARLIQGEVNELNVPVPGVELITSPVGTRCSEISPCTFRLVCLNGMTTKEVGQRHRFRHFGDTARIRRGIMDVAENIMTNASGLVRQYQSALNVAIDDAHAWMTNQLSGTFSQQTIEQVGFGMEDQTSSKYGTLANVIDGMTLIAQNDSFGVFDQWELEAEAHRLMERSLVHARRNDNKLFADV